MSKAKSEKKRKRRKTKYFDYNLLFLLIFLIAFGLVMLYSASSYSAINTYGDSLYYVKHQLFALGLGLIGMIVIIGIGHERVWNMTLLFYVISVILCVLVMVPGIGKSSHGSSRWLNLGPLSFQPSELVKISIILFCAHMIAAHPYQDIKFSNFVREVLSILPGAGIVMIENFTTGFIILLIGAGMLFIGSKLWKRYIVTLLAMIPVGLAFIMLVGYRGTRVQAWLHPETAGDNGYQTMMALYAIGSGGFFGKGLGGSLQKMYVPESQNDMIFSIICEELGLFGAICVILLYILILYRMMVIAQNAKNLYSSMIVVGVMIQFGFQVILNIAVVTNTMPNTGVTLPFISYGGTSILFLMAEMGLVFSVVREIELKDMNSDIQG